MSAAPIRRGRAARSGLVPELAARLHLLADIRTPITEVRDTASLAAWAAYCEPIGTYTPPTVRREDMLASHGDASVPVAVYRPVTTEPTDGVLLWVHGGGFVGGSIEMFESDGVARELSSRLLLTVVSVDYRLVTESVFYPLPVDDVETAWRWIRGRSADDLFSGGPVIIGGASAGAALAAATAYRLRSSPAAPDSLILAYPIVHPALPEFSPDLTRAMTSVPPALDFSGLRDRRRNTMLDRYLGDVDKACPVEAMVGLSDGTGFPPTLIINAEFDALRASGEAFAAQLAIAGVDVSVQCEPGVFHGHLDLRPTVVPVVRSYERIADFISSRRRYWSE